VAKIAEVPLYVFVSLWLRDGQVANFEAYEAKVARIMKRYGGIVERAVRAADIEGSSPGTPFEVHLLRFPDAEHFAAYRADADRQGLAPDRAQAIAKTAIVMGRERRVEVP
jgi:uncharacterized protein (DUF1330 family)